LGKTKKEKEELAAEPVEQVGEAEQEEESYGWEYHKVTLLIAVTLSAIFYILIWIFID
jgi:hypothetical protein